MQQFGQARPNSKVARRCELLFSEVASTTMAAHRLEAATRRYAGETAAVLGLLERLATAAVGSVIGPTAESPTINAGSGSIVAADLLSTGSLSPR